MVTAYRQWSRARGSNLRHWLVNWCWFFGLLVSFSVLLFKKLCISTFTLEADSFLLLRCLLNEPNAKKRATSTALKYTSSKIQKWHSTLLLAGQVGTMKRFPCSDCPPSGQDCRILSTCSLLLLCSCLYGLLLHHGPWNKSRIQISGGLGRMGAHLKTSTDGDYLAVCSPMLTACQDLLY